MGLKSQSCHACLKHHNAVKSYYLPHITVLTDVGGKCGHHQTHLIPSRTRELGKFCLGKSLCEQLFEHSRLRLGWGMGCAGVSPGTGEHMSLPVCTCAKAGLVVCEIFQKLAATALGKLKSWNLWINPSTNSQFLIWYLFQHLTKSQSVQNLTLLAFLVLSSRRLQEQQVSKPLISFRRSYAINDIELSFANTQELFNVHTWKHSIRNWNLCFLQATVEADQRDIFIHSFNIYLLRIYFVSVCGCRGGNKTNKQ